MSVGLNAYCGDPDIEIHPILVAAEPKTRLLRALNREKNPNCEKICRRFLEDDKRFNSYINFEYNIYYNGNKIPLSNFEDALIRLGILKKNLD